MFSETTGTATAEDGTKVEITVQHVAIDPEVARALFDKGTDVGDWGWKHRVWICSPFELDEVRAAARFFYGWGQDTERVSLRMDGSIRFEACYAC